VVAGDADLPLAAGNVVATDDVRAGGGVYAGNSGGDPAVGQVIAAVGANTHASIRADSDCGHGVTTPMSNTNNYFQVSELASTGGANVQGANGGIQGLALIGYATSTSTSRTASAPVTVYGYKAASGNVADADADMNVFAVRSQVGGAARTLFVVDEDGDAFVDGSGTLGTFDEYESDAELVRAADLTLAGRIDTEFGDMVRYGRADLEAAGLIAFGTDDGGNPQMMVNLTRFQRLHSGAIWQLSQRNRQLESRISELEQRLEGIA
jgi:hypothetical protein